MVARAPRKKMYRTMQGRMIDIERLRAANESVQAVGNMNVNARGDVLGPGGNVVTSKETVIQKYYEQPKGMVSDTPNKGKAMPAPQPKAVESKKVATPKVTITKAAPKVTQKKSVSSKKGIDAALDGLE
tara:strand:+ start:786 stop:1172 length:387 start_codon:yes stop_codon:yes gene_type:complete